MVIRGGPQPAGFKRLGLVVQADAVRTSYRSSRLVENAVSEAEMAIKAMTNVIAVEQVGMLTDSEKPLLQ
jgi:hypothetical protein